MPPIKDVAAIAEKFIKVTPQRQAEFVDGVQTTQKDWAQETASAEANYQAGVQAAIQKKSFGKGVRNAGSEKWRSKTVEKGGQRWAPGVQAAGSDYQAGFAPYAQVIASTTLPARYPKGDPRNIERVRVMSEALRKKKVSG